MYYTLNRRDSDHKYFIVDETDKVIVWGNPSKENVIEQFKKKLPMEKLTDNSLKNEAYLQVNDYDKWVIKDEHGETLVWGTEEKRDCIDMFDRKVADNKIPANLKLVDMTTIKKILKEKEPPKPVVHETDEFGRNSYYLYQYNYGPDRYSPITLPKTKPTEEDPILIFNIGLPSEKMNKTCDDLAKQYNAEVYSDGEIKEMLMRNTEFLNPSKNGIAWKVLKGDVWKALRSNSGGVVINALIPKREFITNFITGLPPHNLIINRVQVSVDESYKDMVDNKPNVERISKKFLTEIYKQQQKIGDFK